MTLERGAPPGLSPDGSSDNTYDSLTSYAKPDIEAFAEQYSELTSSDLEHLLSLKRAKERQAADRQAEKIAARAELRDHWRELIPDRPALGAFPRRQRIEDPLPDEWLKEDPRRLTDVVLEMRRFCHDEGRVAEVVAAIARQLDVEEEAAIEAIAEGLRHARRSGGRQRVS